MQISQVRNPTTEAPIEREAGAVIVRFAGGRPELLLTTTRAASEEWSFPKGHIESGETAAEAAVREAVEETGVTARIVARLGSSAFGLGAREIEVEYFLLRAVSEGSSIEGRRIRWVPIDQAEGTLSFDGPRRLLPAVRDALGRMSADAH